MSRAQFDMFATQDDLLPLEPVVYRADPETVRRKLDRILGEAKAADAMPWDWTRERYLRTVFPQMTLWLPDDQASQYRLAFEQELERLS